MLLRFNRYYTPSAMLSVLRTDDAKERRPYNIQMTVVGHSVPRLPLCAATYGPLKHAAVHGRLEQAVLGGGAIAPLATGTRAP